jgi:hypothetical protein
MSANDHVHQRTDSGLSSEHGHWHSNGEMKLSADRSKGQRPLRGRRTIARRRQMGRSLSQGRYAA